MSKSMTVAEERITAEIKQRWREDAALRAEFGDDLEACCAFHRAEARGVTKNYGGGQGLTRVRGKAAA